MIVIPQRMQLSRAKGFKLQAASLALNGMLAVKVDRTSIFGNPCGCQRPYSCPYSPEFERDAWEDDEGNVDPLRCCADVYRHYVETGLRNEPTTTGRLWFATEGLAGYPHRTKLLARLEELRGKNLACWCAPELKCHADVLLEIANRVPT
ncbi:MAG: DUF4326 domain-containing protein [Pseudomonadota bacterium]